VADSHADPPSHILGTMALTRRDVVFAGIASFIAYGYAVYYVPYLRYVGYAFVAGIVCTLGGIAVLLAFSTRPSNNRRNVAHPPSIAFLSPKLWEEDTTRFKENTQYRTEPLYPSSFVISEALDGVLKLAQRDFISSWHGDISKSPTFPNEVDRGIRTALVNIRDRLLEMDIVEVAVSRIVPIITAHLKEFDAAERAVRGKSLNRNVTESEELDLAIAAKYNNGKLHPAVSLAFSDTKLLQQDHLRKIVVRLLPQVLPESMLKSRAVMVLIKEIVACAVLFPLVQLLSDPDTWNQLMENYGRTALQDRKTVRKLRAALDEQYTPAPKAKQQTQQFPRLQPNDTERAFERFIRAIRRCNLLSDARRFRSQVTSQLKRESMVEGQEQTYIRRLETGKRVLDQKVARLTALGGHPAVTIPPSNAPNGHPSQPRDIPLVDVMHNAAGLSYFMEYMDRLRMMPLVQFWIVVDGFRNPLEDDLGDDATAGPLSWSDTDRLDVAQISEAYLKKPELDVPESSRANVKAFLEAGKNATPAQYRRARSAILMAQSAILDVMQDKYYPGFKKADLYYKYLTSDEASMAHAHNVSTTPPLMTPTSPVESIRANSIVHNNSHSSQSARLGLVAPVMARTSSQPAKRPNDLRRVAASSTDIRSTSKAFEDNSSRRSFDAEGRPPLFDDDYDTDPLANSTYSLGKESQSGDNEAQQQQTEVIEAMEAALNDIVTADPHSDKEDERPEEKQEDREPQSYLFNSPNSSLRSAKEAADSPRTSSDFPRLAPFMPGNEKPKPSIASLGLVNTSGRIGVFSDDDLFPDEEKFIEDEYADEENPTEIPDVEEIHEAAPGDLGLAEAISALSADIERLIAQESVVDTLTRKAELTNNTAELRILVKSKGSLQREIRRKEMQRQQYIVQESDNSLYGRSTIRIKSIMVGKEEDGREFALCMLSPIHSIPP
jgi:sorting nexin-25